MGRLEDSLIPAVGERIVRDYGRGSDPSVAVCTLATGDHRELIRYTTPTLDATARRFGWKLVVSCEELGAGRPASWSKLVLVRELLAEHEFVLWVDADALIVDLDRNVIDEVPAGADIWFATHGIHDMGAGVLNAGVFLARRSAFVFDLFDAMWAAEEFIDHNWWENAALLDLLGYSLVAPFRRVSASKLSERIGDLGIDWNTVPGYCEGSSPALHHHARADHDDFSCRLDAIRRDRENVELRFPKDFVQPGWLERLVSGLRR